MSKITIVFLAVCLISTFTTSSAFFPGHPSVSIEAHSSPITTYESSEQIELYTTLANGAFDFFAKLVRSKVEVLLWLKRASIPLLVKGFAHLRHLLIHNGDFVNGIISTVAELLKMLLTTKPHFAVPHVQQVIAEAEHVYIPHGRY